MGNEYSAIARLYDDFRGESPSMWAAYLDELFGIYMTEKPRLVLDLGCGTGTVTAALGKLGYDMTGIDSSEQMLALARNNAPDALLVCQDMRSIELYGTVDAAVCCLDSLNYLPCGDDVRMTLDGVYRYLSPGGVFIFDVNTEYRFEHKYGNNDFILESRHGLIAWSCEWHPRLKKCDFYLSCFYPSPDGRYDRFDEEQTEYCYSDAFLREAAEESGFDVVAALGRLSLSEAPENCEKIHYILKKKK